MNKNSWITIFRETKNAKIFSKSLVEWKSGDSIKTGKVTQIIGDWVIISEDKKTLYIVDINKVRKIIK